MAVIFGKTGKVMIGNSSSDLVLIGYLTSYSLNIGAEVEKVNYMDAYLSDDATLKWDGSKDVLKSRSWSGNAKGMWQAVGDAASGYVGQSTIRSAIISAGSTTKPFLRIYFDDVATEANDVYFEGYVHITTFAVDNDAKNGLIWSFEFVGSGALTMHEAAA